MSLREKAVKGILWSAIQNWGSNLLSLAVFLVLARLLDAEAFGLAAMGFVFTGFMAVFLRQGFGQAIVQRADLEPEHLDTAFWINVATGVVLTAVGIAVADLVAALFREPELAPVVRWLSLSFLIGAFSNTQQAVLRRRLAFKSLAIRSLAASLAGGCAGVAMAFTGCGVWSLVGQSLTQSLVGVVVLWYASEWRPGFRVSSRHARDLFSFGLNIIGIELLTFVNRRSDHLLIGYFLGSVALGYYTVAYGLVLRVLQMLTQTVSPASLPMFSRLQHSPDQMRHAFLTATRMMSLLAFPVFLGMSVLAPDLVVALFGAKWVTSIPVMRVLAFIGMLQSVLHFNGAVMLASGKPSWHFGLTLVNALVNVVAFIIVVRWGIVWVASAYVIRGYVLSPLTMWVTQRIIRVGFGTYLSQYGASLVASLGMVAAVGGARYSLTGVVSLQILLPLCILVGVVVYSLTVLLIAPRLAREAFDLSRLALTGEQRKDI
ncbi:MAG: MOP flippase family protein [Phycisphaerae bacterium]